MRFKMRYWFCVAPAPEEDIGGIVESFVMIAGQGTDGGALEEMQKKTEAQTKVLMYLARELSPVRQRSLAEELGADYVGED